MVSDPAGFADYTRLVRSGGIALTSNFVADDIALAKAGLRGGNFVVNATSALVERLGEAAGAGKLKVSIEKRVAFDEALSALAARSEQARGKTVITI